MLKKDSFIPVLCSQKQIQENRLSRPSNANVTNHKQSRGYKTTSKDLGIPAPTVQNVIKRFVIQETLKNLPGHGENRKIDENPIKVS